MSQVGYEPTIPVLELAKTVHALDRTTTVIGGYKRLACVILPFCVLAVRFGSDYE
jgi:hypothetical protein